MEEDINTQSTQVSFLENKMSNIRCALAMRTMSCLALSFIKIEV